MQGLFFIVKLWAPFGLIGWALGFVFVLGAVVPGGKWWVIQKRALKMNEWLVTTTVNVRDFLLFPVVVLWFVLGVVSHLIEPRMWLVGTLYLIGSVPALFSFLIPNSLLLVGISWYSQRRYLRLPFEEWGYHEH